METHLRKRFIFWSCDSLPVHDPNVEAPRAIARIAGFFENLPGLNNVLGNAFPEKVTFPELSAASRKSGRTALLEEGRRILEVTADSLAAVIERPEHETALSVSTVTGFQQYGVSIGMHHVHKTAASAFEAKIAGLLKAPPRTDRIAGKSLAVAQEHPQSKATAGGVLLALHVENAGEHLAAFGVSRRAGFFPDGGFAARVLSARS